MKTQGHRDAGKCHVKTEVDMEVTQLHTEECQGLQKPGERCGMDSLAELPERIGPADPLISDF